MPVNPENPIRNSEDISRRETQDRQLFNRIAQKYLQKDLALSSRTARRQRLIQTLNDVELSQDVNILEVGCGAGYSAEYLAGNYRTFTGLDYSAELIERARQIHSGENRTFFC